MPHLTEISLYLSQIPAELNGLCIVQVGDLHIRGYGRKERLLLQVLRQGCDMLVFTGDFCNQLRLANPFNRQRQKPSMPGWSKEGLTFTARIGLAVKVAKKLLDEIHCPLGVYAVQGNHDPDDFMRQLVELGVIVLKNETQQVKTAKEIRFNLCGLCCHGRTTVDIPRAVLGIDPALFSIGVCHFPETAEPLATAGVDLILAGHTHGGQICLPNQVPLTTHSHTGRKYSAGLERIDGSIVYTTRGLGYSTLPLRLFCPAEITRLTLYSGREDNTSISRKCI